MDRRYKILEREAETEMEGTDIFTGAPIGIISVVEPDRTNRQLVAEPDADRVTHIVETSGHALERVGRIREQIARIDEDRAEKLAVNWKCVLDIEDGEKFAANRIAVIVRTEIAFAETAHSRAAAIEEAFIDRDLRGRGAAALQAVDDAGASPESQHCALIGESGLRLVPEWNVITDPPCAADKVDVTAERAGREVDRAIEDESAARIYLVVPQIEGLDQADRADEVGSVAEQDGIDVGARHINVSGREDHAHLVMFRNFPGQIESQPALEF